MSGLLKLPGSVAHRMLSLNVDYDGDSPHGEPDQYSARKLQLFPRRTRYNNLSLKKKIEFKRLTRKLRKKIEKATQNPHVPSIIASAYKDMMINTQDVRRFHDNPNRHGSVFH